MIFLYVNVIQCGIKLNHMVLCAFEGKQRLKEVIMNGQVDTVLLLSVYYRLLFVRDEWNSR
jgi:hypothetical protein